MTRFVDLGDQITCDGRKQFAWFDTVTDTFIEICGTHVWESWKDFAEDHYIEYGELKGEKGKGTIKDIESFKRLFGWKK